MVYSSFFFPRYTPLSARTSNTQLLLLHPATTSSSTNYFLRSVIQCNNCKVTDKAYTSTGVVSPKSLSSCINVNYLESEFGGQHGVTFESITDSSSSYSVVVKMALDDGSAASLMLPSGLITSYKAPMWHGGTIELLHTCVSQSKDSKQQQEEEDNDDISIRGGVSLAFTCQSGTEIGEQVSWSPNIWSLHTVEGDPQQLIQVELVSSSICNAVDDMVQIKHIVTLRQGLLSSEIVISNLKTSPISVMGCLISHLNVSTPEATYAVGLEGSDYYSRPPISSNFSIIPPPPQPPSSKEFWSPISQLFSMSSGSRHEKGGVREETEGEETDNFKHLTDTMSRIYTSAPRCFTLMDRGKRNSVEVERNGEFNELYMFSPGSTHKWYGKYAYICVGQSALLKPISLAPGGEWRGSQHLRNPNS